MVKNLPANAGEARGEGSVPGLGRSPGEGNGNAHQYSCLENPMERRSLVGSSPWGRKESDRAQWLKQQFYPQECTTSLTLWPAVCTEQIPETQREQLSSL